MRTDRLGTKLMVTLAALLLLGAACGKGYGNSGAGAGGGTGNSGSTGSSGGGGYGYGAGGGGNSGSRSGSGSSSPAAGVSVLTVNQNNYTFDPAAFSVKSGDTITVKNANANTPHTFTIKDTNVDIANEPLASQDVTIDLAPGTYEFFCKYHVQSGMKGTLTVT